MVKLHRTVGAFYNWTSNRTSRRRAVHRLRSRSLQLNSGFRDRRLDSSGARRPRLDWSEPSPVREHEPKCSAPPAFHEAPGTEHRHRQVRQGESGAGCQIPVGSIVLRRGALTTSGANGCTGSEMGEHLRPFGGYLDLVSGSRAP